MKSAYHARRTPPTVLYEDNQEGALLMANAQKPTKRTRHMMDTQAFALQSRVDQDLISIKRIDTSDNYSDGMTKALSRTLFYRHNDYVIGRVLYLTILENISNLGYTS